MYTRQAQIRQLSAFFPPGGTSAEFWFRPLDRRSAIVPPGGTLAETQRPETISALSPDSIYMYMYMLYMYGVWIPTPTSHKHIFVTATATR